MVVQLLQEGVMNRKLITSLLILLSITLLSACGDIKVQQNQSTVEAKSNNIPWETFITIEDADNYNVTYDASQVDMNTLGQYTVTYSIENKNNKKVTTKDFTFTVEDTTPPEIVVNNQDIKIEQGNSYDPLSFVTITDNYNELNSDSITIDSNVNNNVLGNYRITYTAKDLSGNESTLEVPITVIEKVTNLAVKQTVSIENLCEFYIDYAQITKRVLPPSPSGIYSYYEADTGKIYVDVCFAYKNLTTDNIIADEAISAKLIYADKYNFTGFSIVEEDNRGDFTYSNITRIAPLTLEYIHYLFEVSEDVKTTSDSIVVRVNIEGNDYSFTVR